jgi:HK97 gp10 family phage protein
MITGISQTLNNLQQFKRTVQNNMQRQAMRKAVRPMRAAIRRGVPVETGALKRAIDAVVKNMPNGNFVGIVGARTDAREGTRKPSKYFHLVESGTFRSKAYHTVTQAASSLGVSCINIFTTDLEKQVNAYHG